MAKKQRKRLIGLRIADRWIANLELYRHEMITIPRTQLMTLCLAARRAAR